MTNETKSYPIRVKSNYVADSIIEFCHFRDLILEPDEHIAVYLEEVSAVLDLRNLRLAINPNYDGTEGELEKVAKFNEAENKSERLGLKFLTRKNNIGDWDEEVEIICLNRGRKDYISFLQPFFTRYVVRMLEKNDAFAVQLVDYGYGLLKATDSIKITMGVKIEILKKNDIEDLKIQMATLQLAMQDRITNLSPGMLLGRDTALAGAVEQIPQSRFATPAMIEQAIIDWVGTSPDNLNTLMEIASALGNDPNFATTILNQLALKAPLANPAFTGVITTEGRLQFPNTQIPSSDPNCLDDYKENTFFPTIIGMSSIGSATYSYQTGKYTKIGNRILLDIFLEWTSHTGTGDMRIAGLPFLNQLSNISACTVWYRNFILNTNCILAGYVCGFTGGIGQIILNQIPVGGGAQLNVPIDNAAGIMVNGSYSATN